MLETARERTIKRINEHTTLEANRTISEQGRQINEATADSRAFFASVGGAGSSTEKRAQAAALRIQANEQDRKERAEKKAQEKASKRGATEAAQAEKAAAKAVAEAKGARAGDFGLH